MYDNLSYIQINIEHYYLLKKKKVYASVCVHSPPTLDNILSQY